VQLSPIRNAPYFAQVDVNSSMKIAKAAEYAEVEVAHLHALNPGFTKASIDHQTNGKLLLPIRAVNKFNLKLQDIDDLRAVSSSRFSKKAKVRPSVTKHTKVITTKHQEYTIHSGDTLSSIAKRHHVTIASLMKWNHIKSTRKLAPGQRLVLWQTKRN
jgi:LysM repeat protein